SRLNMPRTAHLFATGPVDWVDRYSSFGIGSFLRRRFVWAMAFLPAQIESIVEIGYGRGFFPYELGRPCRPSVALRRPPDGARVRKALGEDGIDAVMVQADGSHLPFREHSVGAVVMVSTLEFVGDPESCLRDGRRVLRPGGFLVCVRPRGLRWADRLFRWI